MNPFVEALERAETALAQLYEKNNRLRILLRSALHHVESEGDDSLATMIRSELGTKMKLAEILESYRFTTGDYASPAGASYGMFEMPGPCGERLRIMSSGEDDEILWEHVSVSTRRRVPNWIEMTFVKKLFWGADDCVVQFHPPERDYVNNHPHCLHLWRWTGGEFPMPPAWTIGMKELGELKEFVGRVE